MKVIRHLLIITYCFFFAQDMFGLGMSPLIFKNVGSCFQPGYEMYAPMFGSASLSSGFIENLRFYNVLAGPLDQNGHRRYTADKALNNDSIMEVLLLLFPSPAGQLTTQGNAPTVIGNHLDEEEIALVYNFIDQTRKYLKANNGFLIKKAKFIKKPKGKEAKEEKFNIKIFCKQLNIDPQDIIKKHMPKIPKGFQKKFGQNIYKLFEQIAQALEKEEQTYFQKEGNAPIQSFYPPYIIEQIVSAFFVINFRLKTALENSF